MVETNTIGDDERMNDSFKGATYRVERGEGNMYDIELIPHTPNDGFQVGAINGTYVQTHSPLELNALLRTCAYVHPNADYVGYWLDDEGMYHIDPSHYYSEAEYMDAIADARSLNQKAIWSFIQGAEVVIAPTPLQYFKEASETPSQGLIIQMPETLNRYLISIKDEIARLCTQDVNDDTTHQLAYYFAVIYEEYVTVPFHHLLKTPSTVRNPIALKDPDFDLIEDILEDSIATTKAALDGILRAPYIEGEESLQDRLRLHIDGLEYLKEQIHEDPDYFRAHVSPEVV